MEWSDYKVCIGLCNNQDKVDSSFFWNFLDLLKPRQHIVIRGQASIKSASLNAILREAWKWKCDKVIFMDIDQEFPFDTIPKLISRNLPVVSGLYHLKKVPFSPVAGWKKKKKGKHEYVNSNGTHWKDTYAEFPDNDKHLVDVDWVGVGCLMVDMSVFNKIKFPPFYDAWDHENGVRQKGHDILFCGDIKKAGYKVYVDTLVQCSHVGQFAVDDLWVKAYERANMSQHLHDVTKENARSKRYWDECHLEDKVRRRKRLYSGEWGYIVDQLPANSKVAEVGCGMGHLMKMMKEGKNCDCYGYDLSSVAIQELKVAGFKGEVADFRTFKPDGKKYDYVVSSHVLEHMVDDVGFLKKCSSLLKNGNGKVIVSVPTADKHPISIMEHQRLYNQKSFREVMGEVFGKVSVKKVHKSADPKYHSRYSPTMVAIGSQPKGV